jgi:hypothetical protein
MNNFASLERRRFLTSAAAGLAAYSSAALASAAPCTSCVPRTDDLWFINTCGVPCGKLTEAHNRTWSASRMSPSGWQRSSVEQFFADSGDGKITVFFVHGHRVNVHWANVSGFQVYRGIVQNNPPPIRYVIFKWPSDGGGRPIPDARDKAIVADQVCHKLGWFMGHIPPQTPVSLVGFSFGCRVISGALQLSAGGVLDGRTLDSPYGSTTRTVFWAGAVNQSWMAEGRRDGRAILATDKLLNLYNCCDPILRFHPRVTGEEALGRNGLPAQWLGAAAPRLAQRNVCGEVNRLHLTRNYSLNPSIMASTRKYLLWQQV